MATVQFKGSPIRTHGELPSVGKQAPNFKLIDKDLHERSLNDFKQQRKLLATVPSLDTPVCSLSAKKLNQAAKDHPEVLILFASADLPFAQKRVCGAEDLQNIITLSMIRSKDFAKDYGLLIEEGPLQGLCARAIFVIDEHDKVIYVELVPEVTQEPNYDKALKALLGN